MVYYDNYTNRSIVEMLAKEKVFIAESIERNTLSFSKSLQTAVKHKAEYWVRKYWLSLDQSVGNDIW